MRCEDCRFWERYNETELEDGTHIVDTPHGDVVTLGQCKRYPPRVDFGAMAGNSSRYEAAITAGGVWAYVYVPETEADDWCGEFKSR